MVNSCRFCLICNIVCDVLGLVRVLSMLESWVCCRNVGSCCFNCLFIWGIFMNIIIWVVR